MRTSIVRSPVMEAPASLDDARFLILKKKNCQKLILVASHPSLSVSRKASDVHNPVRLNVYASPQFKHVYVMHMFVYTMRIHAFEMIDAC